MREAADSPSSRAASAPKGQFSGGPAAASAPQISVDRVRANPSAAPAAPALSAYRCDGRKHCSQMTSCAEATYFLRHCPGVMMDGDGDGIPCEDQWCR
ncbi:MAG: calcium-binding protein [Burkholderiales bacterium PBB5]|nr:MAG: calcium-binding protein [Burkholderiales bacterium PBB5]